MRDGAAEDTRAFRRWVKFNTVGTMGFLVQLAVLHLLATMRGVNYLVATGIAVQTAVFHNFFWHESFTWADRVESGARRVVRLLLFDVTVGTVSIAGNVLVMRALVGLAHIPLLWANLLAMANCSVLNFFVNDRFRFRQSR